MSSSPGSSGSHEERPVFDREAAGSTPARGSTWHYIVIRKELAGGAALAQVAHAAGESASMWTALRAAACARRSGACDGLEHQLPPDTRLVVLGATKEQMQRVLDGFLRENVQHKTIVETDGPLAGMVTALGVVTEDREALKPHVGELRPWRPS